MADVQLENGHIQIATELIEALAGINLSGTESRCLWVIIRKTYGWKKKVDWIALSQFVEMTGIDKSNVGRALRGLVGKNIVVRSDHARGVSYGIQKNYKKWDRWSRMTKGGQKRPSRVVKNDQEGGQKRPVVRSEMTTTIETPTKDTFTIETSTINNIVVYLNSILNTKYRSGSKGTKAPIVARLKEGYTFEDFKIVIDKKYAEWGNDPEFSKYLRPQTLFGTNFESYLNQKAAGKKQSKNELRIAEIMDAGRN
jgi:phage replication O-like protein O